MQKMVYIRWFRKKITTFESVMQIKHYKHMRLISKIVLLLIVSSLSLTTTYGSEILAAPTTTEEPQTKYDYTPLAESIVAGCCSKYDKAKAIYRWLCENIAYDTTYTIYHADECYEQRRGVCNAYCELYYHLAKCVGIYSRIVNGKSKDIYGHIDSRGHAWIYTVVDGRGMFLDATWGAGTVNNGKFTRNNYIWAWFDVNPKFMIFTHFPDNDSDQFLYPAISFDEFRSLPRAASEWVTLKLDIDHVYNLAMKRELRLPTFYSGDDIAPNLEILEMPLERSLRIGQSYTFRIRLSDSKYNIALINNSDFAELDTWHSLGGGIYAIDYTVRDTGGVRLGYKLGNGNEWSILLDYAVVAPTAEDWDRAAKHYPLSHPDVKRTKNLYADEWASAGVDNAELAEFIKSHGVTELPIFYTNMGKHLRIASLPMHYRLRVGQSYTFSFYPTNGKKWAVLEGQKWHQTFSQADDGRLTITITPQNAGMLYITTNVSGNSYQHCIGYEVAYY